MINAQEQYSIWPTYHLVPNGWTAVGVKDNKEHCLSDISVKFGPICVRKVYAASDNRPRKLNPFNFSNTCTFRLSWAEEADLCNQISCLGNKMSVDDEQILDSVTLWNPLSYFLNSALWLFQQLQPMSLAYNLGGLLWFEGEDVTVEKTSKLTKK